MVGLDVIYVLLASHKRISVETKSPAGAGLFAGSKDVRYYFFGAVLPLAAPLDAAATSPWESLPSPSLSSLLKSFSNGVPLASAREMEPSLSLSIALPPALDAAGAPAEVPLDGLPL